MKRLETETRQVLIKRTVQDILSAESISKLYLKNIALDVGVSEEAIYRYSKSKKTIILSIINDVYDSLMMFMII